MNRRQSERYTRRVEVQFWQPGQKVLRGYSTNFSATGMHISTPNPLPPRSRLRIEVICGERGFLIEGVVAHRRAVHPELVKVSAPGMGVRFMSAAELIGEMLPGEASRSAAAAGAASPDRAALQGRDPLPGELETRTFSVRFASASDFLSVYDRDMVNGGLFVATSRPGRMREVVWVEIHPPGPGMATVVLPARVVQRFEPKPTSGAVLVGMGVELLDRPEALKRLQPVIDQIRDLPS
jgi:PilZ domain